MKIENPVLQGSNPDPSILRVDDDYYIATSTFEWFPGVQVHHSRDLAHCFSAATLVECEPEHFQQLAGLVCYYNSAKFHYLHISHDEAIGKYVRVMSCVPDSTQTDAFTEPI